MARKTEGFSGSDIAVCVSARQSGTGWNRLGWGVTGFGWVGLQVKDVLFEPVRKTQDAMHFKLVQENGQPMYMPCGPRDPQGTQITMQELANEGKGSQVGTEGLRRWVTGCVCGM